MSYIEVNKEHFVSPPAIYMPHVSQQPLENDGVTWHGRNTHLLETSQQEPENQSEAPYCYSFTTITEENKAQYIHYEVGEYVATIRATQNGEICVGSPTLNVVVGSNRQESGDSENSINSSWFVNGNFDRTSFNRHVVEPVIQTLAALPNSANTTIIFADLPDLINGQGGQSDNTPACKEAGQVMMAIDVDHIINPNSLDWQNLTDEAKALHDLRVIHTVAHEWFHSELDARGIPRNFIGEEAMAQAVGQHMFRQMRQFWNTEIGEEVFKSGIAQTFFDNSNIRMQGTGSSHGFAGYEHVMLIEWLLKTAGKNPTWLIDELDRVTQEEQTIACPEDIYINVLPRLFPEITENFYMGHYLGEMLQDPGSAHPEIFDSTRALREQYTQQISYYSTIQLEPKFFEYLKYIHLTTDPKEVPVVVADNGVLVSVVNKNGTVDVLRNGASLSSYIQTQENGLRVVEMAILNPSAETINVQVEPRVYSHTLLIPNLSR